MPLRPIFLRELVLCVFSALYLSPRLALAQPAGSTGVGTPAEAPAATDVEPEADDGRPGLTPHDTYPPCTGPATESGMAAAKGAFQAGTAAFNEADYERAIVYWEDAFRRDCSAVAMLKNLARAYELNEQYQKAIDALTTYVARVENTGESAALARRVENLRRKLEEEEARMKATKPSTRSTKPAQPTPPNRPAVSTDDNWDEEMLAEPEGGGRSVVPLIFAGVGLSAAVLGGIQWQSAANDLSAVEQRCPDRNACSDPNLVTAGNNARNEMNIWGWGVGGGGAALLVGGVIWYFVQDPEPAQDSFALDIGPGFAGARFSAGF